MTVSPRWQGRATGQVVVANWVREYLRADGDSPPSRTGRKAHAAPSPRPSSQRPASAPTLFHPWSSSAVSHALHPRSGSSSRVPRHLVEQQASRRPQLSCATDPPLALPRITASTRTTAPRALAPGGAGKTWQLSRRALTPGRRSRRLPSVTRFRSGRSRRKGGAHRSASDEHEALSGSIEVSVVRRAAAVALHPVALLTGHASLRTEPSTQAISTRYIAASQAGPPFRSYFPSVSRQRMPLSHAPPASGSDPIRCCIGSLSWISDGAAASA
jgi:hypothetical protein